MSTPEKRKSPKSPLTKIRELVVTPKLAIQITLSDEQKDAFVPQYTTLDEINGEVSITATCDTSFEGIYITFEGSTKTFVEKVATTSPTAGRSDKYYTFMRLHQPDTTLPSPQVLKAGETYIFPFNFVVPDALPPQSCGHTKRPGFPEGGHLTLPPSLGDPMVAGMGRSLKSDMAPNMAIIGM